MLEKTQRHEIIKYFADKDLSEELRKLYLKTDKESLNKQRFATYFKKLKDKFLRHIEVLLKKVMKKP